MMRAGTILTLVVLCAAAPGFPAGNGERGAASGSRSGVFGGSTTLLPLFESAIEEFEEMFPRARLTYEAPGSSAGVTGVLDGVYSLAGCSRELHPEEKAQGVRATAVALDGIVIIVNASVGIDTLTRGQAARIFAGQLRDWKDAGGRPGRIVVVNRDEASGTREAFRDIVLRAELGRTARFTPEAVIVESNGDMVTKVGSTPGAIGYSGMGFEQQARAAGGRVLSVDGVRPTPATVSDGRYPVSRSLYVVHRGELREDSLPRAFLDFLLSDRGQQLVEANGFVRLP